MTDSSREHFRAEAVVEPPGRPLRNTVWLECQQVIIRIGWIFKTETIIMPAVLDAVADAGWLRGLLPVLNRGGQSVPPVLFANAISRLPRKKWALAAATLAMAACFGVLAVAWQPLAAHRPHLLAAVFLTLYGLFAGFNGIGQLLFASLSGKLIPVGHRGRAMLTGAAVGSVLAILSAWMFLGRWLAKGTDGFPKIFAITAAFFAAAAVVPLWLDEPEETSAADPAGNDGSRDLRRFGGWWRSILADPALARVCLVAAFFSAVIILFPHYQAFARDRLGTRPRSLLDWVVVQNVATGVASLVAGPLADRRGTKVTLVWLMAGSAITPLVVTSLSFLSHGTAAAWFWLVYVPLGLNPVSLRVFTNYALELAPSLVDQPRYVSSVGAALAAPFVLSPLVGGLVDTVGFRPVFIGGSAVIGLGAITAIWLPEPRGNGPKPA